MSQIVETTENPLLRYEKAKRNGQVEKFKVKTSYGTFFFWTGTQQAKNEILTNMTETYYDGPWLRQIPVEIRKRMVKLRWVDFGSNTGWFAFKLVHGLMPRTVFCVEPSIARFSFLRHNQMMHDRNSAIGLMFKHIAPAKEFGVPNVTVNLDPATGLACLNGSVQVEVPVIGFDTLVTKYNLSALRLNAGGYEKDLLLNCDLKRIKLILARVDKTNYTEKEFKKLKKILKKAYNTVEYHETEDENVTYIIAYRKEMVV
jgi:hypothetical protein